MRGLSLMPQFIMGSHNVLADSLSRPNQVVGSEWTLNQEVFREIARKWSVNIDLFATSLNHRCSAYFAPVSDPMAVGIDAMLQSWDHTQGFAFPPFAMVKQVLNKLRESQQSS